MRVTSQPLIAAYIVGRAADNAGALSAGLAWPRSIDPYLPRSAMPWAMGLCRAHAARSGASMRGAADGVCVLQSGGRGGRRKDEGALPRGGCGGRGGAFMRRVDGGTHHQVARGVRVGAPGCVAIDCKGERTGDGDSDGKGTVRSATWCRLCRMCPGTMAGPSQPSTSYEPTPHHASPSGHAAAYKAVRAGREREKGGNQVKCGGRRPAEVSALTCGL